MSAAIVLHASLPAGLRHARWEHALLQALPYARRLQLEGHSAPQRQASLAGIALALLGAEQIAGRSFAPRDFSFSLDEKPVLRAGPEFSVSHSARYVACCMIDGMACGIDIEDLPQEIDRVGTEKLRRWTATEAVLKAAGRGIRSVNDVSLDAEAEFGVVGAGRYELQPLTSASGWIGHVATRGRVSPSLLAVELDGAELSAALERSFRVASQVD
jgi:phosphopantetheinyl transferase